MWWLHYDLQVKGDHISLLTRFNHAAFVSKDAFFCVILPESWVLCRIGICKPRLHSKVHSESELERIWPINSRTATPTFARWALPVSHSQTLTRKTVWLRETRLSRLPQRLLRTRPVTPWERGQTLTRGRVWPARLLRRGELNTSTRVLYISESYIV